MLIELEVEIPGKLIDVFQFVSNPLNDHQWKGRRTFNILLNSDEVKKEMRFVQETWFLFKTVEITYIITQFNRGKLIEIESIDAPFKITQTILFKESEDGKGSILNLLIKEEITGTFKYFNGIISWFAKKSLIKDCNRLIHLFQ